MIPQGPPPRGGKPNTDTFTGRDLPVRYLSSSAVHVYLLIRRRSLTSWTTTSSRCKFLRALIDPEEDVMEERLGSHQLTKYVYF